MTSVGIIGGGPGGLAVARHLRAAGFAVSLFEAAPELGGLARSFELGELTIERYYHFICRADGGYTRFLADLGREDLLRWAPTRMSFFYHGRLFPFGSALDLLRFDGIPLTGRLRYGLTVLLASWWRDWRWLDRRPAVPLLRRLLGERTYRATWHPLLSLKFPERFDSISAAWVWHRICRVASSRKTPFHPELLGHLEGGTQSLVDAVVRELAAGGVELATSCPVERLLVEGNRAIGLVTAAGERRHFDYLVSAVPLPVYRRLAVALPPAYRKQLEAIDFIGVVCVALHLARPLTDAFWVNVNDPRIPFNGFIEYTNLYRSLVADGTAVVYVPYYLPTTHPRFRTSDTELVDEALASLRLVRPELGPGDLIDFAVSRDPLAQVVCRTGFAAQVPGHRTPLERLFLLESSQLYPSDRTIAGTLDLARTVAGLVVADRASRSASSAPLPATVPG